MWEFVSSMHCTVLQDCCSVLISLNDLTECIALQSAAYEKHLFIHLWATVLLLLCLLAPFLKQNWLSLQNECHERCHEHPHIQKTPTNCSDVSECASESCKFVSAVGAKFPLFMWFLSWDFQELQCRLDSSLVGSGWYYRNVLQLMEFCNLFDTFISLVCLIFFRWSRNQSCMHKAVCKFTTTMCNLDIFLCH